MKKGLTYMLVGAGLGAGSVIAYQQYANGNIKKMFNKNKTQAQNKLGNMM